MDKTTQKIVTPAAVASSKTPDLQIPGYKIIRELGHGGMAYVYLAIQESFGREVALKILSPHLTDDESFSKRFLREARIVSQLSHPNIVTVFDAGKCGEHHYMSMEYIPGKDLKQLKDSVPREEAIRIVKDVARALDFAGKKGIVHRDVKPENIMIQASDNRVVLMDFGIAHGDDVTHGMTQTGKAIGTPHFMSPEQTKGMKVDHRSDIYSLGVVLFQLLAGYLPFDADSAVAVGIKHLTAPIPLLPAGLEIFQPIVNHCLSKQPQHRYQKAAELIAALDNITNEQLENINTQAVISKTAGADQEAETQVSEVSISKKRKIPELVFPSSNKTIASENTEETATPSNSRRNLLFLLLISTMIYGANEKQKELTQYWGYTALPKIVSIFPNLFPKSYSQYWVNKLEKPKQVTPAVVTENTAVISNESNEDVTAKETATIIEDKVLSIEDKIKQLIGSIEENPDNGVELASLYKEQLLQDQQNQTAKQGLKDLRAWYIKQIGIAFATEDAELARKHIDTIKKSFPRAAGNKKFIRLERKVAFLERINNHLLIAENYFKAGALSKPINKNALSEINKVFLISPNNEDAKSFIKKITLSYLDKTTQLQEQGNIQNAILMVEEGIAALNNSAILVKKRQQLKDTIKHNKNVTSLFKQAKKYMDLDQLIKPLAYNAYDIYVKILEKEKGNLQAKAGLKTIHQRLPKKIIAAIKKGNLDVSEKYLKAAIQRYGRSSLLANVQLKLNDAKAAIAPKIETIKLSHLPVNDLITQRLVANNTESLPLKRTLYIGFNFINFDPKESWLDVTIFNHKNIKVAQKPIVITSQSGEHYFEISSPANIFSRGSHKIELKFKNRVLVSKNFLVK